MVELMLAVGVGLLITAGALRIFATSSGTFRQQDELARIQENARFSLDTLSRDIRQLGFSGCLYNNTLGISAAGDELPSVISGTNNNGDNNSDILALLVVTGEGFDISDAAADTITLSDSIDDDDFTKGDYAVIANCQRAEVVLIADLDDEDNTLTLQNNLSEPDVFDVGPGSSFFSRAYPAQKIVYRLDIDQDATPPVGTLVRTVDRSDDPLEPAGDFPTPIADLVTDIQILYGKHDLEDPNDHFQYLAAGDANLDMNDVIALDITLTIQTSDPNSTFQTVIALRNR